MLQEKPDNIITEVGRVVRALSAAPFHCITSGTATHTPKTVALKKLILPTTPRR